MFSPLLCNTTHDYYHPLPLLPREQYVLFDSILKTMPKELKKRIAVTHSPKNGNLLLQQGPFDGNGDVADFRMVMIVRDIYDSLVSGYLYHLTGRECNLDHRGKPLPEGYNPFSNVKKWHRVMRSGPLDPPRGARSLCRYLADESEKAGMRAYVDYIFNSQYVTLMTNWALVSVRVLCGPFFVRRMVQPMKKRSEGVQVKGCT